MSGDIGRGTAHAAAEFAAQVLDAAGVSQTDAAAEYSALDFHSQRHFVQLAGGTNSYSAATAQRAGLIGRTGFGGYAFGGYARKHLNAILNGIEEREAGARIERHPAALNECMEFAAALVHPIKTTDITK